MADVRIVNDGQNQGPIISANVRQLARGNALLVAQVNASGDIVNPGGSGGSGGDGAINDGANAAIKATVRDYANSNPLAVVLTNVSGDAYNAGGGSGVGSNVNIDQVGGTATAVNAGNADNGTLRVVIASDQGQIPVAANFVPPVTGVQIVGGAVGGKVGVSGDVSIRNLNPGQDSVRIHGGQIGVTGDVLLRTNTGTDIGNVGIKSGQEINVREQAKIGTHVAGGQIGVTGDVNVTATNLDIRDLSQASDSVGVHQKSPWATSVTGDVSTTPAAGNVWPVRQTSPMAMAITGDGGVQATVRDYPNSNPIAVVLTNVSGDTYNAGAGSGGGDGTIIDGVDPSIKATVKDYSNSNPLAVILVNASGDAYNGNQSTVSVSKWNLTPTQDSVHVNSGRIGITGDVVYLSPTTDSVHINSGLIGVTGDRSITDGVTSSIKATVKDFANSNPLAVVLVNSSGDVYNAGGGGGAASNVNINQVGGNSTAVNAGNADNGTLRVVIASDQGQIPVSSSFTPPVTGVQIVGGAVGGAVGITGDVNVTASNLNVGANQKGAWAVSLTGDTVVSVVQKSPFATAITGDVLLRSNPGVVIGNIGSPIGAQIVGGAVGGTVGISGDASIAITQKSTLAVAVTGDVLLRANPGVVIGNIGSPVGVQVVGGAVGGAVGVSGDILLRAGSLADPRGPIGVQVVGDNTGRYGVSGDVSIKPSTTTNIGRFAISGDTGLSDGSDRSILATVKDYTNSNPLTVVLVNPSGDAYLPVPEEPICATIPFRITAAGTTTIAGPYNGRVIKVSAYAVQAESDTAQFNFGSGASGDRLSHQWLLNAREGANAAVPAPAYIFKTGLNRALVIENAGANIRGSVTFHTGDAF